jgi:hypothetical protein
VVT